MGQGVIAFLLFVWMSAGRVMANPPGFYFFSKPALAPDCIQIMQNLRLADLDVAARRVDASLKLRVPAYVALVNDPTQPPDLRGKAEQAVHQLALSRLQFSVKRVQVIELIYSQAVSLEQRLASASSAFTLVEYEEVRKANTSSFKQYQEVLKAEFAALQSLLELLPARHPLIPAFESYLTQLAARELSLQTQSQ